MGMLTRRILKPNDRTLPSSMYFSEWISKGFSLFILSASFPALLLYEPWCLPGIGTGIVGTQTLYLPKEEAHEISGTSYITFFFSLLFCCCNFSVFVRNHCITIKQKKVCYKKKISFRDRISNKVLGWLRVKSTGKGCRRCFWYRLHSLVVLSPLSWKYNNNNKKEGEEKKKVEDPTQKETRTRHTKGYTKV